MTYSKMAAHQSYNTESKECLRHMFARYFRKDARPFLFLDSARAEGAADPNLPNLHLVFFLFGTMSQVYAPKMTIGVKLDPRETLSQTMQSARLQDDVLCPPFILFKRVATAQLVRPTPVRPAGPMRVCF